mgnify:FL=1
MGIIQCDAKKRGFTLVEILVVLAISLMLLSAMQMLFSQGVRSTVKGQDTIDSIRAAGLLFSQLRKDLLACKFIDTGTASVTVMVGAALPSPLVYASQIIFSTRTATTTYRMVVSGGKGYVEREVKAPGKAPEVKPFAVPRMQKFQAVQIWTNHKTHSASLSKIVSNQILIRIEIDSMDPRFPSKTVHLDSFFTSNQKTSSDWWNYYYPNP